MRTISFRLHHYLHLWIIFIYLIFFSIHILDTVNPLFFQSFYSCFFFISIHLVYTDVLMVINACVWKMAIFVLCCMRHQRFVSFSRSIDLYVSKKPHNYYLYYLGVGEKISSRNFEWKNHASFVYMCSLKIVPYMKRPSYFRRRANLVIETNKHHAISILFLVTHIVEFNHSKNHQFIHIMCFSFFIFFYDKLFYFVFLLFFLFIRNTE